MLFCFPAGVVLPLGLPEGELECAVMGCTGVPSSGSGTG